MLLSRKENPRWSYEFCAEVEELFTQFKAVVGAEGEKWNPL